MPVQSTTRDAINPRERRPTPLINSVVITSRRYRDLNISLRPDEVDELRELAERAGVSITDACRYGARMFLEARLVEPTKRGRPHKRRKEDAKE